MRLPPLVSAALAAALVSAAPVAYGEGRAAAWERGIAVVGYSSPASLAETLRRHPAQVVRRIPALRVAEVRPREPVAAFAAALRHAPGILYVEAPAPRVQRAEPAVVAEPGGVPEWQWAATRADALPPEVLSAASAITIAVVDTGADVTAPDLAAKSPETYSVVRSSSDVSDRNGHGTFVSALAAGSPSNGDGIAGFGGEARLLVVQASAPDGSFSDVDEASAIAYAVDHGAKIVNLSLGGPDTSSTERNAIEYAVQHGVLLVAAAGNEAGEGNPVEYPAALVQPVGSNGVGGVGLAVAASTATGGHAAFSNTGSWISLAAPGDKVFSALSSSSSPTSYPRAPLAGSHAGLYGYGSGTSFAAPQVAGAAALVWAAQPALTAQQVAEILKETASGGGSWGPELGYGVIDVAAAVARAGGGPAVVPLSGRRSGSRVQLAWSGTSAQTYRLTVSEDSGPQRVVVDATTNTSASYAILPGHVYSFTVAAVDATGAERAVSRPYQISFQRAGATLRLSALRRGRRLVFTARLRPGDVAVPASGRTVALESFDGKTWRRTGSAVTGRTGSVTFGFPLAPGTYRVRARLAGADDLQAAVSPLLTVRL